MEWNIVTQRDVNAAVERQAESTAATEATDGPPPPPAGTPTADDFWNRLMKGIPLPVIGGYLAASDILNSVTDTSSQRAREVAFWLVFLFFVTMTPLFAKRILKVTRRRQRMVSAAAFATWGFALGGPFDISFGWWAPWMGALAVILGATLLWVIDPASEKDDPIPVPVPV
jgi:hypothetical protein